MEYNTEKSEELFALASKREYTDEDFAQMEALLQAGANPNHIGKDKYSYSEEPLLAKLDDLWSKEEHLKALTLLVKYNVSLNFEDSDFELFKGVVRKEDYASIDFLIKNGATDEEMACGLHLHSFSYCVPNFWKVCGRTCFCNTRYQKAILPYRRRTRSRSNINFKS